MAVMVGQAQDAAVQYAPVPSWVVPMQPHAIAGTRSDGAVHFTYSDFQVMSNGEGTEEYSAYRVKLLRPDALAMGNINLAWMPEAGAATVHHLRIIRDGQVIDVLKDTTFAVFQPPNTIEQAILSGLRVANLQVPGLRVGDELEFAATVRRREIALPDHSYGVAQVAAIPASGSFRTRMMWVDGHEPAWRVSSDISGQLLRQRNAVEVQLDDPAPLQLPVDSPARFAFRRALEFSDFKAWRELSATLAPLYGDAAQLPPDSRVRALAAQMKATNADPISRARAALRTVQDDVRYVYVGMNGGNLVPARAETTWERRYGDCKGKTVLLMALLAEMGIASRPVVVSSEGGDGLDRHLPIPQFFDHVLVQAELDGKWYWLDGTRSGGLGLGLAIARGIVEAQGGCIQIRSGDGSKGTKVVLTLPIGEG